jgi:hypothetical protein
MITRFFLVALVAVFGIFSFTLRSQPTGVEPLADINDLRKLAYGEPLAEPPHESSAIFHGTEIMPPSIASAPQQNAVLGVTAQYPPDQKRIEVDLTNQKVYAFENNNKIYEFVVSTGKWGRTPTGEFTIWAKVPKQKMSGGSKALGTYYYLPNVPWVMFFHNSQVAKMRGYSFHGTYWHDKFGTPQSHGCINMKTDEAKILFDWATPVVTNPKAWSTQTTNENPGTKVVIYGVAPKS